MATEFIIKKGRSSVLFDDNGACRISQEKLIENGWYLTTDTAEVYVALRSSEDNLLHLRKLNECDVNNDLDLSSFEDRLDALEVERTHVYGYRKDFPAIGERDHMYIAEDEHRTYIFANERYIHIADNFDSEDHDNDPETPEVRVIYGGSAE
jgi:hypothetical protein